MTTFLFKASNGTEDFGSEYNKARYITHLSDNEGKQFKITKVEGKRTLSQNNYYWHYLSVIEFETGNTAYDLNEWFKRSLLPPKFIYIRGKTGVREIKIPRSTTDLNKIEMGEYLDRISAETEVALPNPEELEGYLPH